MLGVNEVDMYAHHPAHWNDGLLLHALAAPLFVVACSLLILSWMAYDYVRGE